MKNKRLQIRRYTACLLMLVMIVTQYISPYAQVDGNSIVSRSYEVTIELEENKGNMQKAADSRSHTATVSEPEEKNDTSKEDIDVEEELYDDEIPLYDDRYGDATDSAPKAATMSNALRIAGNTYTLRYWAYVDGKRQMIYEEEVYEGDDGTPPAVPEREGYTFAGWSRSDPYVNVQASRNIYATYVQGDVNMHVVNFRNADNRLVVNPEYVQDGKGATYPAATLYLREGYTFLGWDKDFYKVTEDLEVGPRYLEGEETVYYLNYRGYYDNVIIDLKREWVPKGEDGSPPEIPEREGYTFTGWHRAWPYVNVQQSTSVNAYYIQGDVNMHVVNFRNADNRLVVNPEYVQDGKGATYPAEALYLREGYTFLGWDKEFYNVTEDLEVGPRYLEGEETVYYLNYRGYYDNVIIDLKREWVPKGEDGSPPEIPEREGYTFIGWHRAWPYVNVQQSTSVHAYYIQGDVNMHVVNFRNADNRLVVNPEYVQDGKGATYPAEALYLREGYTFLGWDKEFYNVTEDLEVGPRYLEGEETVYYLNYRGYYGNVIIDLKREWVPKGEDGSPPKVPEREGYTFAGWHRAWPYVNVQQSTSVNADYIKGNAEMHVVRFVNELGRLIVNPEYVQRGKGATHPAETLYKRAGYTFLGLNQEFYNVTGDMTIRPRYMEGEHTVYRLSYLAYYNNASNVELKREWVLPGADGTPPNVPVWEGRTFSGWLGSYPYVNVTASRSIYAGYLSGTFVTHKVGFYDYQGKLLQNPQYVVDGKAATAPAVSKYARDGYTFLGWNQDFYSVKSDLAVKPEYISGTYKTYQVTYRAIINESWMNIRTEYVPEGRDAKMRPAPDRVGYKFVSWGTGGENITKATTLTAQYETVETHTVTFMIDDTTVKTVTVNHGGRVEFPTDDEIRASGYLVASDLEGAENGSSRMLLNDEGISSRGIIINPGDYTAVFIGWNEPANVVIRSDEIIYGKVDPDIWDWLSGKVVKVTYKVESETVFTETLIKEEGDEYVNIIAPVLSYVGLEEREGYTFRWNISEYGAVLPGDLISAKGVVTIYGEYQKNYNYSIADFNGYDYVNRTNCYAYAFDLIRDPNGDLFQAPSTGDYYGLQPGRWNIGGPGSVVSEYNPMEGADRKTANRNLDKIVKSDAKKINYSLEDYKSGMSGGYRVLLFAIYMEGSYYDPWTKMDKGLEGYDYHWWRLDSDGTWSNKHGATLIDSMTDIGISISSGEEAKLKVNDYYEQTFPYVFLESIEEADKALNRETKVTVNDIDLRVDVSLVGYYYVKDEK